MQRLNRKGLSEVVTAIIVILLVLVAVGIIWAVVQNLLNQGAEEAEGGVDCITTQVEVESATRNVGIVADLTDNRYDVAISRDASGTDTTITQVKLIFTEGGQTKVVGKTVSLDKFGTQSVQVTYGESTDELAGLGADNGATASKLELAVIIGTKTCDPTGETSIA